MSDGGSGWRRYNYNFRTNINWLGQTNGYLGKVVVDVQPARFAADRPECSLNLQTPCDLDGTLVSTMPAVQPLSFSVLDFTSFYQNYVGFPPTNAVSSPPFPPPPLLISPSLSCGNRPCLPIKLCTGVLKGLGPQASYQLSLLRDLPRKGTI